MAGNTVVVSVLADTRNFASGMKETAKGFDFLKVGAAVAAAGVALIGKAVADFAGDAIKAGSDAQQSINGVATLFGENAATIIEESKKASRQWGISAEDYRQSALIIEGGMKRAGLSFEDSRRLGDDLRSNLLDLVAVYGGDLPGALDAYGAAMRGEFDPLEQFGVKLKESMVQAKAKEMGLWDGTGALDEYARALATTTLIEEQSADVQGAAAGRAETFAGKVEALRAKWDDFKETIGLAVLPILETLLDVLGPILEPILNNLSDWFAGEGTQAIQGWIGWVRDEGVPKLQEFADWFVNEGLPAVQDFAAWVRDEAWPVLQDLARVVTEQVVPALEDFAQWCADNEWLFAAIGDAIKDLITRWADLVAAVTAVVEFFGTARDRFAETWDGIKQAFADGRQNVENRLAEMRNAVQRIWDDVVGFFRGIPGRIRDIFAGAAGWLRPSGSDAVTGFQRGAEGSQGGMLGWFSGLGGRVAGAVGYLGGVLSGAGSAIISGFVGAAQAAWNATKGFFSGIAGWIKANKGPVWKDRELLRPAGQAIMAGFRDSLAAGWQDVQRLVDGMAPALAGSFGDTPGVQAALASGGTVNVYQLDGMTINATDEDARLLAEFMDFARRKMRAGVRL